MKALAVLIIPLLLLSASCGISSPKDADKREIQDILYEISQDYNWGDIEAMLAHTSIDYRHDGMQRMQLRQLWLDRMGRYPLMEITDVKVSLDGENYAVAGFRMILISSSETDISVEPEDNGDLSYFYHDGYQWKLHGNQEFIKSPRVSLYGRSLNRRCPKIARTPPKRASAPNT